MGKIKEYIISNPSLIGSYFTGVLSVVNAGLGIRALIDGDINSGAMFIGLGASGSLITGTLYYTHRVFHDKIDPIINEMERSASKLHEGVKPYLEDRL